jgi:glycosyltransferase involved in cell wall biosynthesis
MSTRAHKALILGHVWPEPRSSAAGARSLSLIRAFRERGFGVDFASEARDSGGYREALHGLGAATHEVAANDPAFDSWIAALRPEVVVFERFLIEERFGWRVAEQCPESMRILDTVDLHSLRRARREELPMEAQEDTLRELGAIYRCDLSLLISAYEHELLRSAPYFVSERLLHEWGFCYDPPPSPRPDTRRSGFAVIGNFRHEPNADGVRWLKAELWPRIRAGLPDAQVQVWGAYPPREIMELEDPGQGFYVRGPAPDQFEALAAARVNLAPLRFGAGLKGKIADGWWSGTPCVTTPVGAEGMCLADGAFGGAVADAPQAFAEAAVRLHESAPAREQARATGYRILSERFDHARNARALLDRIEAVRADLPSQRAHNVTGRMLAHHERQCTKYFSRWIELKNRLIRGE